MSQTSFLFFPRVEEKEEKCVWLLVTSYNTSNQRDSWPQLNFYMSVLVFQIQSKIFSFSLIAALFLCSSVKKLFIILTLALLRIAVIFIFSLLHSLEYWCEFSLLSSQSCQSLHLCLPLPCPLSTRTCRTCLTLSLSSLCLSLHPPLCSTDLWKLAWNVLLLPLCPLPLPLCRQVELYLTG